MPRGEIYRLANKFRRELLQKERRAASELVRRYGESWKRVQARLDALHKRMAEARKAGEAIKPVWLFQEQRLEQLRAQIEAEIRDFAAFAEPQIVSLQREAVDAAQGHARALVEAQLTEAPAGFTLQWDMLPSEALHDLIGFLQDGSPLREVLEDLAPGVSQQVADALVASVALGLNPRETATLIRRKFATGLARTLTISRTETMRAYREAARRSMQANQHVVKGWYWHAALGPRTCAMCLAMHGTFHTLDEVLDDHPNGRCTAVPAVKTWKELGFDIYEEPLEFESGSVWLLLQPDEVQQQILGKSAWYAWKARAVDLKDFVGRKFDPLWGSMRYKRSLKEILGEKEAKHWLQVAVAAKREEMERYAALLKRDKDAIQKILGDEFTSTWSGVVRKRKLRREAAAMKDWSCSISVNSQHWNSLTEQERRHVLIHELLHSYSVGLTPEDYATVPGWEEGVVEKLAYRMTEAITKQPDPFQTGYTAYMEALEGIRNELEIPEDEFYKKLLSVPLRERESYVYHLGLAKHGKAWYTKLERLGFDILRMRIR